MGADENATPAGVIHNLLGRADTSWSIGVEGAIGEFTLVGGDPPPGLLCGESGGEVVTERGALRVALDGIVRLVAWERLSAGSAGWTHGLEICVPADAPGDFGRTVLTDLGADRAAIRPADRAGRLFDLGVGALHLGFCVRTGDAALAAVLAAAAGQTLTGPPGPTLKAIRDAHPHRVVQSRLARIEVYQKIGGLRRGARTPAGPHTHFLPERLGRTASRRPVPDGWVSALTAHPGHPLTDRAGRPRPFDIRLHADVQSLLARFGPAGWLEEKTLVTGAVAAGLPPERYRTTAAGADAVRVALLQLRHTRPDLTALEAWLAAFPAPKSGHGREPLRS